MRRKRTVLATLFLLVGVCGGICLWLRPKQRPSSRLDELLLAVAEHGTISQAQQLLSHGANIEARRRSEPVTIWEPLINLKTVIEYPNYPFQLGYTPLMLACIRGDKDMVRFLLQQGANPNANLCIREMGSTPSVFATDYNHPDIVVLLKRAGARQ